MWEILIMHIVGCKNAKLVAFHTHKFMDIHGISLAKTPINAVPNRRNKLRAVEFLHEVGEIPRSRTSAGAVEENHTKKPRQPVQSSSEFLQNTSPPIDFQVGAIGTFINEMHLIHDQMLAPAKDVDLPQPLDALA
jgi:hypothetical protein